MILAIVLSVVFVVFVAVMVWSVRRADAAAAEHRQAYRRRLDSLSNRRAEVRAKYCDHKRFTNHESEADGFWCRCDECGGEWGDGASFEGKSKFNEQNAINRQIDAERRRNE